MQMERTAIMLIKMKWIHKSTGNKFSCHLEVLSVYLTFRPYYYFFLKLKLWLAFSTTLIRNVSIYHTAVLYNCVLGSLCWTSSSWIFLKNLVWYNCLLQLLWIHSKMAVVVLITFWTFSRRENFILYEVFGRNVTCSLVKTLFEISKWKGHNMLADTLQREPKQNEY